MFLAIITLMCGIIFSSLLNGQYAPCAIPLYRTSCIPISHLDNSFFFYCLEMFTNLPEFYSIRELGQLNASTFSRERFK